MTLSKSRWLRVAQHAAVGESGRSTCVHRRSDVLCVAQPAAQSVTEGHSAQLASLGHCLRENLRGTYMAHFCVHALASPLDLQEESRGGDSLTQNGHFLLLQRSKENRRRRNAASPQTPGTKAAGARPRHACPWIPSLVSPDGSP